MSGPSSPATRFHDVEVANDQTGARWRASVAFIREGLIVVPGHPPPGLFDQTASTFTITAYDEGGRLRRFPLVTLNRPACKPGEFAFA